jgi:hypothetical protein
MMASRYSAGQSSSVAGLGRGVRLLHVGIAAHLAAGIDQHGDERLEHASRGGAIDQQGLGRAAHAGAAHLGVQHDLLAIARSAALST